MRKTSRLILALLICMSLSCTAFATSFTASVVSKSAPEVVELVDETGNCAVAKLNGALPEGMAFVSDDVLVVTAVADAAISNRIPDASEKALMEVYKGLQAGTIQVPFEELDEKNAQNLVVRDLFDVSWTDTEGNDFAQLLDQEDVSLEITFAMEIEPDAKVYVLVYKNDTWSQIQQVINNGDGTITCVFDHLCPVAVVVEADETMEVVEVSAENADIQDAQKQNVTLWIVVLTAAVIALTALFVGKRKMRK